MAFRRVSLMAAVILAVFAATGQAETITFDEVITGAAPPNPVGPGLALDYSTPSPMPSTTFVTQGYTFGGFTDPITVGNTQPSLSIVLDPSLCNSLVMVSCLDNGTQYLGAVDPFALLPPLFSTYSLLSLDAGQVFQEGACPGCADGDDIPNAVTLRLIGFRLGMLVADETLTLTSSFQTFVLTDPEWANVNRTVFLALDGAGGPGFVGIDNIVVETISSQPVPEPPTLLLLGLGLVVLTVRRYVIL